MYNVSFSHVLSSSYCGCLQYFVDYKLAGNETDVVMYRNYFLSIVGFATQIPNCVLSGLNVFIQCKG